MVLFENNTTRLSMYLYLVERKLTLLFKTHLQKLGFENQLALQKKK
jgi:hypothetical protein